MATFVSLKKGLSLIFLGIALTVLLIFLPSTPQDSEPKADRCLNCHSDVADMSSSHPVNIFGCASCHLGNPYAADEKNAHAGIVRNPSDLLWAEKTCGQAGCHTEMTDAVQKSIMASNSGLVTATLLQWYEKDIWEDSLITIDGGFPDTSLATSHIRKLCAGCHINKRENDFPGEIGSRGGGCNDCHIEKAIQKGSHPTFTVRIGIEKCEKCHNRSNRTALNYQGKCESERYGTPYSGGNTSTDTLSGGRYFYHIPADVHFEAGMVCIDCHIMEDVMGDGKQHAHLEDQVHIRCEDCHDAKIFQPGPDELMWKVIQMNKNMVNPADSSFAVTQSGFFYPNVFREGKEMVLIRKLDGKKLKITQTAHTIECNLPGHERLSCQSCHTAYAPQCYGCHDVYDPNRKQMDKVSYMETDGHWSEGRSYMRFEKPSLAFDQFNRVMPVAPGCQVFMTDLTDSIQKYWPTMAAFDPHITRTKVPRCESCHSDPKRLGLGDGILHFKDQEFTVSPVYNAQEAGLGDFALEQFVDKAGKPLQRMSREQERPFTRDELISIVGVSLCIVCHDSYTDAIYKNFDKSLTVYKDNPELPCRLEP